MLRKCRWFVTDTTNTPVWKWVATPRPTDILGQPFKWEHLICSRLVPLFLMGVNNIKFFSIESLRTQNVFLFLLLLLLVDSKSQIVGHRLMPVNIFYSVRLKWSYKYLIKYDWLKSMSSAFSAACFLIICRKMRRNLFISLYNSNSCSRIESKNGSEEPKIRLKRRKTV